MDLEVLRKEKNELEFKLLGQRHAFPNLLRKTLTAMKEVEFVSYRLNHPMDADSVFFLRTKNEDPKKVLQKAIDQIVSETKEFDSEIKKLGK